MNDDVRAPYHYIGDDEVDCTRATKAMLSGYALGEELPYQEAHWCANTLKYLWRWSRKGGIKDLMKAREYLDYVIKSAGSRDMNVDAHLWIKESMNPQAADIF